MTALAKFAKLTPAERVLVMRAIAAVLRGVGAVKLRSYRSLRRRISTVPPLTAEPGALSMERMLQIISAVARRIPGTTCLSNAIAARDLLARYGYACTLRIGVTLEETGGFLAHSWLEVDGKSVFGGTDSGSRYAALELGPAEAPSVKSR